MNKTLFFKEFKSNWKLLLIFAGVLTIYSTIIVAMFDPKLGDSLNMLSESMPQLFAAFGMLNIGSTLADFVVNYLYGFLLLAFPTVFIILLVQKLITRYNDTGAMAYLISSGNTRRTIITTQYCFMLAMLALLTVYLTGMILLTSQLLFPGELAIQEFLVVNVGLFAMLALIGSLCFFSACAFAQTRLATGFGGGLVILFLLIQMIGDVSEKLDFLQYFTPMTLFNPQDILAGSGQAIMNIGVIAILAILLGAIGIQLFTKKDLSL